MVKDAPMFHEIAKRLIELTDKAVFVAHNVRFDYSFIRAAYKNLGYQYQRPTLCTVRLSRKVFLNLKSYSLGKICESLSISIKNRHRAMGDAYATSLLFKKIFYQLSLNNHEWLSEALGQTKIPPMLENNTFNNIPENMTGIYYFYNKEGEVIYIGKGKDIKKRIEQHFAIGSKGSRRALKMKTEIADIGYENTGNELIALLLESDEIKKLKPIYNISQKKSRSVPLFATYIDIDNYGYKNLSIDKYNENKEAIFTMDSLSKTNAYLYQLTQKYQLCLKKMSLQAINGPCFYHQIHQCKGACIQKEPQDSYNERFEEMINQHSFINNSFLIVGEGRVASEKGIVYIDNGQYKGFGYLDTDFNEPNIDDMISCIKRFAHNRDIQQIIALHQHKFIKITF
jgi:DNA polymerase III subunit epsilon